MVALPARRPERVEDGRKFSTRFNNFCERSNEGGRGRKKGRWMSEQVIATNKFINYPRSSALERHTGTGN